jgi:predicted murein hydrolase (TIGR00659 family)
MNELLLNSSYAGVAISLITYMVGVQLKKKFKIGIFNPLLISIAVTIIVLLAANIEFETYKQGAKYISWFLTPATVCLAIPLYEQLEILKKHWKAVIAGIVSGVITNMITVAILALLFGLNHQEYVTLLPKSITTAIGMGVSEELGGYVTITVAVIVITGVIGNMLAEFLCKIFRIEEPMAKGLAIGTSAHAMGTAKAMEMGDVEGAMSSLSIAVAGILTVGAASIFAGII